jgi:predicted transcriptional regulator
MVVGARRTGLSVSRIAMLLGFSLSTVSRVYQEWSTTQRTSRQLDKTVESIRVNMDQHPCGTLSVPCRVPWVSRTEFKFYLNDSRIKNNLII